MIITVDEGRELELFVAEGAGTPLIFCHGTPGCGMLFETWVQTAAQHGLRLVGYSRPGYGRSQRNPGRTVADCIVDVIAIADHLDAEHVYVLGHSGGGSHALACAALAAGRVLGTAVIAGAAPRDAAGLDWFAGQLEDNVEEFQAAERGGEALRSLLERWRCEMLAPAAPEADAPEPAASGPDATFDHFVSEADRRSITPASAAFAAARQRHALSGGIWGWYDDDLTETVPWGFGLDQITVPVSIWHGGQDRYVPIAHGRWLSEAIPGARRHLIEGEGHFSLLGERFGDVIDDLTAARRVTYAASSEPVCGVDPVSHEIQTEEEGTA